MTDLDRKLFELCKPEGVWESIERIGRERVSCFRDGTKKWFPSSNWSDLEPLIVKAAKELDDGWFEANFNDDDEEWVAIFETVPIKGKLARETGSTLCESAARALISLKESAND